MSFRHFNHLNIPEYWERYFTKYPQGMTILESLFEWVSQVDSMVDNQNELNDAVTNYGSRLDDFITRFDSQLQEEVTKTLTEWQVSGFLDVVINEAIQTQTDDLVKSVNSRSVLFDDFLTDTDTPKTTAAKLQNVVNTYNRIELTSGKTYLLDGSITLPSNTHLEGNGAVILINSDIIKNNPYLFSTAATSERLNAVGSFSITNGINNDKKHHITIENINFNIQRSDMSMNEINITFPFQLIHLEDCSHVRIINNQFNGDDTHEIFGYNTPLVQVVRSQHIEFSNNTVVKNEALQVIGSTQVLCENNSFTDATSSLEFIGGKHNTCTNNHFYGDTYNYPSSVISFNTPDSVVSNNYIEFVKSLGITVGHDLDDYGYSGSGISGLANNTVCENNTIASGSKGNMATSLIGIFHQAGEGVIIRNNTLINFTKYSTTTTINGFLNHYLIFSNKGKSIIEGNFLDGGDVGIRRFRTGGVVRNNTIQNTHMGIEHGGTDTTELLIDNNTIENTLIGILATGTTTKTLTNNTILNANHTTYFFSVTNVKVFTGNNLHNLSTAKVTLYPLVNAIIVGNNVSTSATDTSLQITGSGTPKPSYKDYLIGYNTFTPSDKFSVNGTIEVAGLYDQPFKVI